MWRCDHGAGIIIVAHRINRFTTDFNNIFYRYDYMTIWFIILNADKTKSERQNQFGIAYFAFRDMVCLV